MCVARGWVSFECEEYELAAELSEAGWVTVGWMYFGDLERETDAPFKFRIQPPA